MLNIVIPMAGAGSRFQMAGYARPKPFIDIGGKMMVERVLDGLQIDDAVYTLIIQQTFLDQYRDLLKRIQQNYRVSFLTVERLTQGASCTALAAHEIINNSSPVIFADSDNFFRNDVFRAFAERSCRGDWDGALLTFQTALSCYSFVEVDAGGIALQTREKEVISNHAITGVYQFQHGCDFVKYAIAMMIYGDRTKSEYYLSNVYNYAIRDHKKIGIFDIQAADWCCVGTPAQLDEFLKLRKS